MTMLEIERLVSGWTVSEAAETYDIARWGNGYFSVNASGNVAVHPTRSPERAVDLKLLVDRLVARESDSCSAFRHILRQAQPSVTFAGDRRT